MNTPKFRVYLGHKLTNATPEFLKRMEELKAFLKKNMPECVLLDYSGVTAGTPLDVWVQDIEGNVATCDLFVAFLEEESSDMGLELGAALYDSGKPILLLANPLVSVSYLLLGAVLKRPNQIVFQYVCTYDCIVKAIREMNTRFRLDKQNPLTFPCVRSQTPTPIWNRHDGGVHGSVGSELSDSGFLATSSPVFQGYGQAAG